MREMKNVEERILDRALYLMGKNKRCDISIRAIAKEAGVNVSAINYYFRTKEEMLRLVKEFYIGNTQAVLDILKDRTLEDEERLLLAANEIMEYALRFPGNMVIHTHSLTAAASDEASATIVSLSEEIGLLLQQALGRIAPGDEMALHFKYVIFTSSVNYPAESEEMAPSIQDLLEDREGRLKYLRLLLDSLKAV
ncbi:TetR/AcrR family transcriptional regulator [Paenibacillus spiritus]|uniref:TetR/AcrR family transcriptional regulator n=1 Tax=Paenibacillus spiritus TaxID=2496557 RepID=A0A5J5G900_9BACL|nr:TetR/AcrR family transcriptional regulator [Paenibacillus spiritus]KAA9004207.1 TetR/AcrR family transcriptional regulator [Paenibacillus spiritus]